MGASHIVKTTLLHANKRFIRARRMLNQKYDFVEENKRWNLIISKSQQRIRRECLFSAYRVYLSGRMNNPQLCKLTKTEFMDLFLCRRLNGHLDCSRKRKRIILKLQKRQDDNYEWDKRYSQYKRGDIPAKSVKTYLSVAIGLVLAISSFLGSILASQQLFNTDLNWLQWSFLILIFVSNLVYCFTSYETDIKLEIESSDIIIKEIDSLLADNVELSIKDGFGFLQHPF